MVDEIIDAPIQTADATPPAVPDVLSTKGGSLTASQGDAFSKVLDPKNYESLVKDLGTLTTERIKKEEDLTGRELALQRQYDARQERLLGAESATMDDLRPWNAEQQMAKYSHNLWEDFGSPGFIIGMLASQFTGMPMTSALNAGAAAINAINAGDDAGYHKAFDAWKENTNLTIKRMDLEAKEFDQISHLQKNRMDEWRLEAEALAAKYNDKRLQSLLGHGMDPDAIKIISEMNTLRATLSDASSKIQTNEKIRQYVNAHLTDKDGKPTAAASDPKKWLELHAIAERVAQGPDINHPIVSEVLSSDEYLNASNADQQTMLHDAVKKENESKYFGRGAGNTLIQRAQDQTDSWRDAQIAAGKPPSEQEYTDKFRENLSANTKAAQPVQAQRAETDVKKLQEEIRHHEQEEFLKAEANKNKASGGGISGNRADQIQRQIDAYDNNLEYIKEIKEAIEKYHFSVGLAGKALRAGERLSDVLFGSNQTDRVQIMRDLEKLKLGASRLLLDAEGRPLSTSEHRIDDIIGGGSYGDLTENTLRSLDELQKDYQTRRGQHNKRLPENQRREPTVTIEQPTITDKPASWEDIPSVTRH